MTFAQRQAAYELLNVSKDADPRTVRSAWRKMVRAYHPDLAKDDPVAANRKLVEINAAFDLIGRIDPETAPPKSNDPVPATQTPVSERPTRRTRRVGLKTYGTAKATLGFPALETYPWSAPVRRAGARAERGFQENAPRVCSCKTTAYRKVYA